MSEIDGSVNESDECSKSHEENIMDHSNSVDHCEVVGSDEDHNGLMSSGCKNNRENTLNVSKQNKSALGKHSKEKSKLHRRSRARNMKKRKWKPYCRLTWEERRKLEERDSRRAFKIREQMSSLGITLAPYNTTQFLMEDHNLQEPDYEHIHSETKHRDCASDLDSDGYYSSPEDEEDFLQQQFTETYESAHNAYLNDMTKFEIVRELMKLEDEAEEIEKSLKNVRDKKLMDPQPSVVDVEAEMEKIKVFKAEIEKLMKENYILSKKNERLHRFLTQSS